MAKNRLNFQQVSGTVSTNENFLGTSADAESGIENWVTYNDTQTATITIATPAVVSITSTTGMQSGDPISFTTTGALPTGLIAGTVYYITTVVSGTQCRLSATLGGADINTSGTQSGTHTFRPGYPTDATGGSANVTWTTSTTTPLSNFTSFLLTKDANNRMGEGASLDFIIDNSSLAKVLKVEFDYLVSSGTFVAGNSTTNSDINIWLYDITNGTRIQPSTIKLYSNSTTIADKFSAYFQTPSNSNSYRLIIQIASPSSTAYTLKIDNVSVSKSQYVYGTPITDWQSYGSASSLTGFGTATALDLRQRRVGSSLQVNAKWTAGTRTAVEARLAFPSGLTSLTFPQSGTRACGTWGSSATGVAGLIALVEPTVQYFTFGIQTAAAAAHTKQLGNAIGADAGTFSLEATCEIQGWSSSVQMSDSTDSRVVAAQLSIATSVAVTSGNPIKFLTTNFDTHAGYNSTTGEYTIPIAGIYIFTASLATTSGAPFYSLQINGAARGQLGDANTTNIKVGTVGPILCNAGDIARVVLGANGTPQGGNTAWYISRVSGPSAVATTETIAVRYKSSAGNSVANTGTTRIDFATKDFDTHSAVTTGASWIFTAPASGKYEVRSTVKFSSSLYAAGNIADMQVFKNGSLDTTITGLVVEVALTEVLYLSGSTIINLIAGDTLDLRLSNSRTAGATTLTSTASDNTISINRVGL